VYVDCTKGRIGVQSLATEIENIVEGGGEKLSLRSKEDCMRRTRISKYYFKVLDVENIVNRGGEDAGSIKYSFNIHYLKIYQNITWNQNNLPEMGKNIMNEDLLA